MPIPNYLKEISCDETRKGSFTIFTLKCPCGSTLFDVFESYLDQAEREACKPYCDALDRLYMSGHASTCTVDEDGTVHHWILLGEDLSGPKEEVFVPKPPVFSSIQVIKAKCSRCQKEQILFDSRYHGYSGKYGNTATESEKEYIPHFRQKRRRDNLPVSLGVQLEYDDSLADFQKNTGIACDFEDYSDAYTWITIYAIDENGKKRKLFERETD